MVTKFTRLEFSQACNIPNNTLTILAKRGKISINSARCAKCEKKKKPCHNCKALEYIDLDYRTRDGFYINLDFFKKQTQGIAPPKPKKEPKPVVQKLKPPPEISVPVVINSETDFDDKDDEEPDYVLSETSSDERLKRAKTFREYENKKAATRLLELQEAKLRGELIATDQVKEMIQIFAESVKRAYADAGENMIIWISERLGAQEHDKAAMRAKLLTGINTAVDNSVDAAQSKMEDLATVEDGND